MQNRFDITYHKTATTDKIRLNKPLQRHLAQPFHKTFISVQNARRHNILTV
jgi:hypothetical protein